MAFRVQGHEGRQLGDPGVEPAARAGVGRRHGVDDPALEARHRPSAGHLEVVVEGAGHEHGDVDRGQVDRSAEDGHRARLGDSVVLEDLQELGVQRGREGGPVGVPGQDVEGGQIPVGQPLVDDVGEDQVVGAHPGEHRAEARGRQNAPLAQRARSHRQQSGPQEGAEQGRAVEVEHRDGVPGAVHPAVAERGEVVEDRRHDDAAGAEAHRVHVGGPGDLAGDVDRRERGAGVGVQVPVRRGLPGVAPADHEHRDALAHRVLDEAAPLGQVEEVVTADRRRDHDERPLAHLRRAGRVLDQFEGLLAVDHGAGGDGEVPAHREGPAVDLGGQPAVAQDVATHGGEPADHAPAAGLQGPLERRGVADQGVRRRQRSDECVREEAGLLDLPPVGAPGREVVDQAEGRLGRRQIQLRHPSVDRVARPGRVGEPLVLR
jgi:hypothetical protein